MNKNDQEFLVQKIRTQYTEKEHTGLDELKELDTKVKRPANVFAYIFGSISAIIMGAGMSLVMTDIGGKFRQSRISSAKRIQRFMDCVPLDWGNGWDNVIVGCTVENQQRADERLSIFSRLPIKHKNIICQPMISAIDLEQYLSGVELVVAGGESDRYARPMDYS